MSSSEADSPARDLTLELVNDEASLATLEPVWRNLAVSSGNAFVTPEWYALARERIEPGSSPLVAVAHDDDGVAGILPMVMGPRSSNRVRFAGARLGDKFGPLVRAGCAEETPRKLLETVAMHCGRSSIELSRMERPQFAWPAQGVLGRSPVVTDTSVWPAIDFDGGWDEYLASRSRNHRSQIRRRSRNLEREHVVETYSPSSPEEVTDAMGELFRVHAARWGERLERSSFDRTEARDFHSEFALRLFGNGWLRLFVLRADGLAVAAWYGWRLGPTFSYYQAGFDPAWSMKSVGAVLFANTIKRAAEEGAASYDMLLGDEEFKLRFATRVAEGGTVTLSPRWGIERMRAVGLARIRPLWRALPASVRSRVGRRG